MLKKTLIFAPGRCLFSIPPFVFFADATPPPSLLDRVFHRGWRIDIHDVENILLVAWVFFDLIFVAMYLDERCN